VSDFEVSRRVVCISGKVTDARDGTPVVGARVAIVRWPSPELRALFDMLAADEDWTLQANRPDVRLSGADGRYFFLDLPAGEYELKVDPPDPRGRLRTLSPLKVTVQFDSGGHATFTPADAKLPSRPLPSSSAPPAASLATTQG
jgi:Carboxypeptidase regulatory-like domain